MATDKHTFRPETLMMSYGYKPELSEGALKCPIFQTSTFVFKTAEEGKAFFEVAYGHRDRRPTEEIGLIYSRLNNPDLEILENRLTLWDGAEDSAVFESGMSAISTAMLEFLHPGDLLLYSTPLYGGTIHFIQHVLTKFGINVLDFRAGHSEEDIIRLVEASGHPGRLGMIYIETPANPTNSLIDIECCKRIAKRFSTPDREVLVAVDNTYLGPLWQHPLKQGADLVLYSATKYLGGHSDIIAGACLGAKQHITRIKTLRTFLGNMAGPWTGWLLMRSLETLKPRMELQVKNAAVVAVYLRDHPMVKKVHYLGFLTPADGPGYAVYRKQCLSDGAMISFDIRGGEHEAFVFLNSLKLIKLAVSLGGTESLAEHPATMTHCDVAPEERDLMGIGESMVRLSIGGEHPDDLLWDIGQALATVEAAELAEAR
ncbi:MAG TPA: cystathionine gamma-synthase family protein [Bacteroidota bacterium]|nr:cystathionine gamma-synthase family protein [Bacteroidota bacterium]